MKIINIIGCIVLLILFSLFSTIWNFENTSAFDTIVTFLSVTTGFTITALSIIATSNFSKKLYLIEDKKDNSRTLLHVLIRQFKIPTLVFISTIALILAYKFFPASRDKIFNIKLCSISLMALFRAIIWVMTILSFYSFFKLFDLFAKFVIQAAKK